MFKNRIQSRLGATAILRFLGFEDIEVKDEFGTKDWMLMLRTPNLPVLQAENEKILMVLNRPETRLHTYLSEGTENTDRTLMFLMVFRKMLDNISIAPSSSTARKVGIRSA